MGRSFRAPTEKHEEIKKLGEEKKRPSWLHGRREVTDDDEEVNDVMNEQLKNLFGKYLNKYFKNMEV